MLCHSFQLERFLSEEQQKLIKELEEKVDKARNKIPLPAFTAFSSAVFWIVFGIPLSYLIAFVCCYSNPNINAGVVMGVLILVIPSIATIFSYYTAKKKMKGRKAKQVAITVSEFVTSPILGILRLLPLANNWQKGEDKRQELLRILELADSDQAKKVQLVLEETDQEISQIVQEVGNSADEKLAQLMKGWLTS